MDENLQRLTRALRSERCPARALDKVQQQIAARRTPVHTFRLRAVVVALGLAAVATMILIRFWPISRPTEPVLASVPAPVDQARVAREASFAMAYVARVLLEAKEHNETVLLNEAVPRLRSGFETASKIIQTKL
jgi:hypothetical protein